MPLDTGSWYPTSLAEALTHTPLRILFVIVVAVGARLLVVHMIRRTARLAIARPAARKGASAQRRSQRLGALASLASSVVTGMFAVITLMIVLAELDFNVTY
ncbi:MAG TPA: hypothetical protein IAA98_15505 [Candidatus Avipropionibacterium avicola]|uniref:Uncharacterized protein n=1 Tax=Candidatus Avipropionibacterium avicola TaxID=2840701 RepID=A0A9D1KQ18_9ACTN|nr:hypothetical protein [Candidatus Avipropionibacterium avicola]